MSELSDINVIKDVLSRHGFSFSKALGQNFLVNPSVCPKMAQACGADENTGVIKIGAGIGVLTKELAKRAKKVLPRVRGTLGRTIGAAPTGRPEAKPDPAVRMPSCRCGTPGRSRRRR